MNGGRINDAAFAARRERLQREPWFVGRAHAAGVAILAGTDTGNPYVFPGWALHEELELLVSGGLAPIDALRAATINPARFLNEARSTGVIAPGRTADVVLLESNPLADITNTRRIRAVVVNGRYLDRAALDQLLASVERAASEAAGGPFQ